MQIIYKLTEEEYVRILQFHFSKDKRKIWLINGLIFLIFIFYTLLNGLNTKLLIIFLIYILLFGLGIFLWLPWLYKKSFKKQKLLSDKREMNFSENGFSLKTKVIDVFIKYEAIEEIRENNEFILLYISSNTFHFIPIRVLNDLNSLEKYLKIIHDS